MKLLLQVADRLVEKGHVHATSIKSWVAAVDKRYKDFSCRMEKHRVKLETTLGLKHDVSNSHVCLFMFVSSREGQFYETDNNLHYTTIQHVKKAGTVCTLQMSLQLTLFVRKKTPILISSFCKMSLREHNQYHHYHLWCWGRF